MPIVEQLNGLLGTEAKDLTILQVSLRAFIVYMFTVAIVRLGHKRFMGRSTAFDVILGIILGSVVSRAINGQAPFFITLVASALLVALHWVFSFISFHSKSFSELVKGKTHILIKQGELDRDELRRNHITKDDVIGELRMFANTDNVKDVQLATLENSGQISTVLGTSSPRIIEVRVEEGVQTIRILL